ncbi:MAG: hypothetical protein Q9195_006662 [Heterodermia aff. obscurata]
MSSLPSARTSFNTEELVEDSFTPFWRRLDTLRSSDFCIVNLCVLLNAHNFHVTVAQTRDVLREFTSALRIFQREQVAARSTTGFRSFTLYQLTQSHAVIWFLHFLSDKGFRVDLGDAASLFNFLLHYNANFRKEEFRAWYAEKKRRREAREWRRKRMVVTYLQGIEALEAEMTEDCRIEFELLGTGILDGHTVILER